MLSYCIAALILLIDVNWGEPTVLVDVYFSDGVEGEEKKFKRKAYQMIGAYGFLFGLQYVCYFFCHRVLKGKVEKALDEVTEHIDRSLQAQADTGARNDSNNSAGGSKKDEGRTSGLNSDGLARLASAGLA